MYKGTTMKKKCKKSGELFADIKIMRTFASLSKRKALF